MGKKLKPEGEIEEVNLRELREMVGVTQVDLAEAMGTVQPEVSKMERRKNHRISTITRFVEALGGELQIWVVLPENKRLRVR